MVVRQVYGRTAERTQSLAQYCGAEAVLAPQAVDDASDLYLFALKDDAYPAIWEGWRCRLPLAVHTAGSLPHDLLSPLADQAGILYPCQTLSCAQAAWEETHHFELATVPLIVDATTEESRQRLYTLAQQLSPSVHILTDSQRQQLHLAAVFASNFTNAMYAASFSILEQQGIDKQIIYPLIQHTLEKAMQMEPWQAQTGPARRNDHSVMRKQYEALHDPILQEIYQTLSSFIIKNTKS